MKTLQIVTASLLTFITSVIGGDLTITDMSWSPNPVRVGDTITVSFTVENAGSTPLVMPKETRFQFVRGQEIIGAVTAETAVTLAPGATWSKSSTEGRLANTAGTFDLTINGDVLNVLTEENKENNSFTASFRVLAPGEDPGNGGGNNGGGNNGGGDNGNGNNNGGGGNGNTPGATVTVSLLDKPETSALPKSSQIPFLSVKIKSSEEPGIIRGLTISVTEGDPNLFSKIQIVNDFGRIIGNASPVGQQNTISFGTMIIPPQEERTLVVSGVTKDNVTPYAGTAVTLSVTAIHGSPVSGLPLTGATHSVDDTHVIGSLSVSTIDRIPRAIAQGFDILGGFRLNTGSAEHLVAISLVFDVFAEIHFSQIELVSGEGVLLSEDSFVFQDPSDLLKCTIVYWGEMSIPKEGMDIFLRHRKTEKDSLKWKALTARLGEWLIYGDTYGYGIPLPDQEILSKQITVEPLLLETILNSDGTLTLKLSGVDGQWYRIETAPTAKFLRVRTFGVVQAKNEAILIPLGSPDENQRFFRAIPMTL